MGPKGTLRAYEAAVRRHEREAQKQQRELARRAQEQAKLSVLEQARLEVDTYENQVEMLLSVHKEQGKSWDWLEVLSLLPPPSPQRSSFHEFQAKQRLLVSRPDQKQGVEAVVERARAQDEQIFQLGLTAYPIEAAERLRMKTLARRILDGEHKAYTEALAEFSPLAEISDLGSSIHFTIHNAKLLECVVNVNGKQAIPKDVKSLTANGKLSVKPMPKGRFHEIYEDYLCGCVFRVAREVFALLPVDVVLITAVADSIDPRTGHHSEKPVLSVVMPRSVVSQLDFERLDPSDAIENFQHRAKFKGSRKSEDFEAITPISPAEITHEQRENMDLPALLRRASQFSDQLRSKIAELKRPATVPMPEPNPLP
jgi:hypothetical protein